MVRTLPRLSRVLLVDDDANILLALRRLLGRRKVEVLAAPTAAAALEVLAATPCDAVIADYRMPGSDGVRLLGEVAARHPETTRILMSGYRVQGVEAELEAGRIHHFLQKPIEMQELLTRLGLSSPIPSDDR